MRSKSDSIVAKYLIEALDLSKKTKFEEALQKINIAKILAPNYFEVFKTEAWIEAQNRNSIAAQSAYESALLLEPDSAPLLFFYGGFLLRQMSASDKAREQFIRALEKDPHSFYIKLELLRANLFTKQFTESEPLIKELLVEVNSNNSKVPVWGKKKAHDLTLQYYQRIADFHHVHKDYKVAIDNLEKLKEHYNGISMYLKDQKMKEKLEKSLRTARSCSLCIEDISYKNKAKDIYDWIHSIISNEYNNSYLDEKTASRAEGDGYQSGKITNIQLNKGFGFIRDTNGVDVFLHKSQIGPVFYKLSIGTNVRFKSKEGDKGLSALQVIIVE
jgi:cold shock CspA family protein/tetratricopeptide (TPR) repeat protein